MPRVILGTRAKCSSALVSHCSLVGLGGFQRFEECNASVFMAHWMFSCEMWAPIPGLSGVASQKTTTWVGQASSQIRSSLFFFSRTSDKKTAELGVKIVCGRVEVGEEEVCVGSVGLKLAKAVRLWGSMGCSLVPRGEQIFSLVPRGSWRGS